MFDFCPHCGQTPGGQEQIPGQILICPTCKKPIGLVPPAPAKVVVDRTDEILRGGTAARCSVCSQLVEIKDAAGGRSLAPHFTTGEKRRVCPGSGKPAPAAPVPAPANTAPAPPPVASTAPAARKDLSAHYQRDTIRVAACRRNAEPTIEELRLEYLDKADRVRLQIDALRDLLGKTFQMKAYPPELNRPHLALWANADLCVVGKRHAHGGYDAMGQEELLQVVAELRQHQSLFFR